MNNNKQIYEGKVMSSNNSGDFVILEYIDGITLE